MSAFDSVIGYDAVKKDLTQIIDMIKNPSFFENLGAQLPHGIMMKGDPGTGKTTICKAFIKESGLPSAIIHKDAGADEFIDSITDTFEWAAENSPCIVLLDDMDKFSNEDEDHPDTGEYVAVQSGMDSVKNQKVIVLATVNNERKLPDSLKRAGRFDRTIELPSPSMQDAVKILEFYMKDKKIDPNINKQDVVRMMGCNVAAEMESILNESAIVAGFERSETIQIQHIVKAVLRKEYNCMDNTTVINEEEFNQRVTHEAGHLTIALALNQKIGLVSVMDEGQGDVGGFVSLYESPKRRPMNILIKLGGKAACELYYPNVASGCHYDLHRSYREIERGMDDSGTLGLFLIEESSDSEIIHNAKDVAVRTQLELYMTRARNILLENRDLLEAIISALKEKHTLLFSDVEEIVRQNPIHYAVV